MTSRAQKILNLAMQAADTVISSSEDIENYQKTNNAIVPNSTNQHSNEPDHFDIESMPIVFSNEIIQQLDDHGNVCSSQDLYCDNSTESEREINVQTTNCTDQKTSDKHVGFTINPDNEGSSHGYYEHNDDYQLITEVEIENEGLPATCTNSDEQVVLEKVAQNDFSLEQNSDIDTTHSNSGDDYDPSNETDENDDSSSNDNDHEEGNIINNNIDSKENNNNSVDWGDMNEGRKRRKTADKNQWKRNKNQRLRMKGEKYLGFSRDKTKNFQHNVLRQAREIGQKCSSKMCQISKKRFCNTFSENVRRDIFTNFWKNMTWDQRKVFVAAHVSLQAPSRKTSNNPESRRGNTLIYRLNNGKALVQVCRNTFLSTTGLGRFTVESWVKNSVYGMNDAKSELNEARRVRNHRVNCFGTSKDFLKKFLEDLPKQPSHYVRKDTNKLYLEQHFTTLKQLYNLYKDVCEENNQLCLGIKTFRELFKQSNLSLFSPKKDRCDLCIEYERKNADESAWKKHMEDKNNARNEQISDKSKAVKNECVMLCMDLQAVKVAPSLNATKIYFKTKLGCHNFTIYNCATHQATCYWFTEIDCGLTASTFVSCLINYLEKHCLGKKMPIIIYSDGCTFQNRNNIMANALLNFSMLHNIPITQKYLTKGHTQMECDSVHSCIERKLKNRVIELPSDYVKAAKEARSKPEPYEVIQLSYDFFKDYTNCEFLRYHTIRPGRNAFVTEIKALDYDPNGKIKVKLDFTKDFEDLPSRPRNIPPILCFPDMYKNRLPITQKKWKHLQELKSVISQECHLFYDLLPYTSEKSASEKDVTNANEEPASKKQKN